MAQTSFDSRRLGGCELFQHTFSTAGTVEYSSSLAPSIKGLIKVKTSEGDPPELYNVDVITIEDPLCYVVLPRRYVLFTGDTILWSFPGYQEEVAYDIVGKEGGIPLDSRLLSEGDSYGITMFDVGRYVYKAYREEPAPVSGGASTFELAAQGEIIIQEESPSGEENFEIELPPAIPNPDPIQGSIFSPILWTIKSGAWYIICEKVS